MKQLTKHEAFEAKVGKMADGFRAMDMPTTQLLFRDEAMLPAQAAQRLQGILESFQGVRDAEAAHGLAIASLEEAMPHHVAFYEDAVAVVKSHFGTDRARLASFGLGSAKKGTQRRGRGQSRPEVIASEREVIRTEVTETVTAGRGGRPVAEVVESVEEVVVARAPARRRGERHPIQRGRAATSARSSAVTAAAAVAAPASTVKRGKSK